MWARIFSNEYPPGTVEGSSTAAHGDVHGHGFGLDVEEDRIETGQPLPHGPHRGPRSGDVHAGCGRVGQSTPLRSLSTTWSRSPTVAKSTPTMVGKRPRSAMQAFTRGMSTS